MPLSLGQMEVGAIVDWNVEWRGEKGREKEFIRNPIRRGMIVRIEGEAAQEAVEGIWVTFGEDIGKDKFEYGGVQVKCVKVPARELNLAYDAKTKIALEAWKRTFKVPDQVGTVFEARAAKSGKPKIVDALQLTGAPSKGPIEDGPSPRKTGEDD